MVLRTYIDKTNTIISNSHLNTGQNPVSELFYGVDGNANWTHSRLLLHFDIQNLVKHYQNGMLGQSLNQNVKHILKLTNTGSFHDGLLNKETYDGKHRTSSFTLVAYPTPQYWDEGVGYDYQTGEQTVTSTGPSNWFNATTTTTWGTPGAKGPEPIIAFQKFDAGNENLELDVTTYVNEMIMGIKSNYGITIAFEDILEVGVLSGEPKSKMTEFIEKGIQYVGFFTNNTQTFYEPCIETKYSSYIRDDRQNFYLNKLNRLYLYVNANGEPMNLDTIPSVSILTNDPTPINILEYQLDTDTLATDIDGEIILNENGDPTYTKYSPLLLKDSTGAFISSSSFPATLPVVQEKTGVYYVEFGLDIKNFRGPKYFSDNWTNIKIDGRTMKNVQMGFEIQNGQTFYDIGMGVDRPNDYKVVISGIRNNESITRGDVRRIKTNAMIPYTVDQKVLLDGIQYRLFVKEGNIEHTVIDFEDVERSYKDNYFLLDTMSLLPNVYYLDIQMHLNQEIKTSKEVIKFQIVDK